MRIELRPSSHTPVARYRACIMARGTSSANVLNSEYLVL